jgi:uncharacterized protein HemY
MTNLLHQAIDCDDGDHAARIIQDALGIESDDVVNYCFPKEWPADHEQRARIIGTWLANRGTVPGFVTDRRFPPPWIVEEANNACFVGRQSRPHC